MNKENIEKEVEIYPSYCEIIMNIESGLNNGLEWYLKNYNELCAQRDFRPGTLGRLLSSLISIRFSFMRTFDYVKTNPNWDKDFLANYQIKFTKPEEYLGNFRDIDTMHRFYLFHSIYHQWETTLRIVHEGLKLKKGKPTEIVNEELGTFDPSLLNCIYAVRNTIHNNGYYRPLGKEPEQFEYKCDKFETKFVNNEKVDLNTGKVLLLLQNLILQTEILLKHPKIIELPIIIDRG